MIYLYGVVRAGHPAPDRGGLGQPPGEVRVVESGAVAALVSELPDDYAVQEEDARTHLHVLVSALGHGPVVPLRLGTAAADDDEVRSEVLGATADDLRQTLDAIDGLVELHVDADDDEADVLASIGSAAPTLAGSADLASRIEVGRQVAALVTEHRQAVATEIVERLRRLAVDDVARSVIAGPEDPVLRWAFLVRAEDVELFDDAIIALRSEYPGLTFRYIGPLPAAHFVASRRQPVEEPADSFRGSGSWGW